MLNNIGYLAYISTMAVLLIVTPSSFIKKGDSEQEQSIINVYLSGLLQTELGLRICGLYHLILLAAFILKQEQLKFVCLNVYALFLVSTIGSLFFDGVGQTQSERLERFGYQAGIFSVIAFNNWPQTKQEKKDSKVEEQKSEAQTTQKVEQTKEKEKSNENTQKDQKQGKKKGKAKNE
ncbi:unnamed protein product (macronuclear) [Paramecium tetraurelia]|uniref:Uncharacterized protein n=1 Tax=Paramecium tetraurelia TaxID=5888 RepID=A0E134_PARTE|nr:uncharacterized protein GSPATT00022170001 [Paramecium tetraurelia]CAK89001.1 unnamed protein product [Paramecium tetraurelia]|eukprot:XP_001456398.1 hypothetical protein (macronuclear) [Paramecium tetraurelia strain d4-2]